MDEDDHRTAAVLHVVVIFVVMTFVVMTAGVITAGVTTTAVGRGPDVQVQAVLAADGLVQRRADRRVVAVVGARAVDAPVLHARVAELLRLARLLPAFRVDWRLPAQVADGCLRERHTLPRVGAGGVRVVAAHDGAEAGLPLDGRLGVIGESRGVPGKTGACNEERQFAHSVDLHLSAPDGTSQRVPDPSGQTRSAVERPRQSQAGGSRVPGWRKPVLRSSGRSMRTSSHARI